MPLSLLLQKNSPRLPTTIDAIELDATLSEGHELENKVTEFPIESGGVITDHIFKNPDRVTVQGFITNSPVLSVFDKERWTTLADKQDRVQESFRLLRELRDNRVVFDIQTGLQLYNNMVITRLSVPIEVGTGDALKFTVDCQQIAFATSQTASVDAVEPIAENVSTDADVQAQASAAIDAGQQAASEATEVQSSWLSGIIGSITGN